MGMRYFSEVSGMNIADKDKKVNDCRQNLLSILENVSNACLVLGNLFKEDCSGNQDVMWVKELESKLKSGERFGVIRSDFETLVKALSYIADKIGKVDPEGAKKICYEYNRDGNKYGFEKGQDIKIYADCSDERTKNDVLYSLIVSWCCSKVKSKSSSNSSVSSVDQDHGSATATLLYKKREGKNPTKKRKLESSKDLHRNSDATVLRKKGEVKNTTNGGKLKLSKDLHKNLGAAESLNSVPQSYNFNHSSVLPEDFFCFPQHEKTGIPAGYLTDVETTGLRCKSIGELHQSIKTCFYNFGHDVMRASFIYRLSNGQERKIYYDNHLVEQCVIQQPQTNQPDWLQQNFPLQFFGTTNNLGQEARVFGNSCSDQSYKQEIGSISCVTSLQGLNGSLGFLQEQPSFPLVSSNIQQSTNFVDNLPSTAVNDTQMNSCVMNIQGSRI